MKRIHCIVNFHSAGGNTKDLWKKTQKILNEKLGDFTWETTKQAGGATPLARNAAQNGTDLLILMGGDGTISEAIDGCMQNRKDTPNIPVLALLNSGSGGDFCRTLGIPKNLELAIGQIKYGRENYIDVGHAEFFSLAEEGKKINRYFINIAGFGMSSQVVKAVTLPLKQRFGDLAYLVASMSVMMRYQKPSVRISMDGQASTSHNLINQAICNGRFFGGGMCIAPQASLQDGLLDMVLIEDWNKLQTFWNVRHLYRTSTTLQPRGMRIRKGKEIYAEPENRKEKIFIDCDGELCGMLPLRVKVIPKALRFIY